MPELPTWIDRRVRPGQRALLLRVWPWLAPGAFVSGFLVDAATLRRVDDIGDNLQLTLFLLGAGALLVLERRAWHGRAVPALVHAQRGLLRLGMQVLFGGLFSAYVIFYSQSATFGPSLLFCALLAGLMLANELFFEKLEPDVPQVALWFFCALSYLLFAVPTWTGHLGWATRVLAALLALLATAGLVALMHWGPVVLPDPPRGPEAGPSPSVRVALLQSGAASLGLLLLLWVGVLVGAVPPVPLALADAGIFHGVERSDDGFLLTWEEPPWYAPWRSDDRRFVLREGDKVHCFTAVFAPSGADLAILHAWEHREEGGDWQETDRIPWQMKGGRDGGWRSWTAKRNVSPGDWRVRVLSEHGDELGRVRFEVVLPEEGQEAPARRQRVY